MATLAQYPTAGGAIVTVDIRSNAFDQTVYAFECTGCDGIRGFNADGVAHQEAAEHAGRCTDHTLGSLSLHIENTETDGTS